MFVKFNEISINLDNVEVIVLRKNVLAFKFDHERNKEIVFENEHDAKTAYNAINSKEGSINLMEMSIK